MGSSAGGEQPKFTALVDRAGARYEVIVKFSPPRDQLAGLRWSDLLVCEHVAQIMHAHSVPTAQTQLVETDERLCLAIERFDRAGQHGRRGTCAFSAIADALGSDATTWLGAAKFLFQHGLVEHELVDRASFLEDFGKRIGNTDRHLGNLALLLDGGPPFKLAPVYDMLPMHYRPSHSGELVERGLVSAPTRADANTLAIEYWRQVGEHPLISADFHRIAQSNAHALG